MRYFFIKDTVQAESYRGREDVKMYSCCEGNERYVHRLMLYSKETVPNSNGHFNYHGDIALALYMNFKIKNIVH